MWRVRHTLALMCAKNHLLTFSSFLDIWENVEWPRFFWTTLYLLNLNLSRMEMSLQCQYQNWIVAKIRVVSLGVTLSTPVYNFCNFCNKVSVHALSHSGK